MHHSHKVQAVVHGRKALNRSMVIAFGVGGLLAVAGCDLVKDKFLTNSVIVQNQQDQQSLTDELGPISLEHYTLARGHVSGFAINRESGSSNADSAKKPLYFLAKEYEEKSITEAQENGADARKARYYRDSLIDTIQRRSEKICAEHQASILANSSTANFTTGFISTGLSAVSAAVGGETIKTILSTSSSIVNAGGTGIRAEFYQNLLAAAIVKKISEVRAETLQAINQKQKDSSVAEYGIDAALLDVEKYHKQCSFYIGLVELTDDADKPELLTYAETTKRIKDISTALTAQQKIIQDQKASTEERVGAQRQYTLLLLERERLQGLLTQARVKVIRGGTGSTGSTEKK